MSAGGASRRTGLLSDIRACCTASMISNKVTCSGSAASLNPPRGPLPETRTPARASCDMTFAQYASGREKVRATSWAWTPAAPFACRLATSTTASTPYKAPFDCNILLHLHGWAASEKRLSANQIPRNARSRGARPDPALRAPPRPFAARCCVGGALGARPAQKNGRAGTVAPGGKRQPPRCPSVAHGGSLANPWVLYAFYLASHERQAPTRKRGPSQPLTP